MGWQELLLIVVLVILFVRPKDIPLFMRSIGLWVGQIRGYWSGVLHELERTEHNISVLEEEKQNKIAPKRDSHDG